MATYNKALVSTNYDLINKQTNSYKVDLSELKDLPMVSIKGERKSSLGS